MMIPTQRTAIKALTAVLALSLLSGCSVLGRRGNGPKKTPTIGARVSILNTEASAEVDPALAGVSVLLPPAQENASWGQPGGNASKSMEHPALEAAIKPAWTVHIAGSNVRERLGAAPVVDDGRVFVVDTRGTIHAYDIRNGGLLWEASMRAAGDAKGIVWGGGVSAEGGVVYATNGAGEVAAFDAKTGNQIWRKRPGGPLRGAPSIGLGNIYVMSSDNQLFAIRTDNGEIEWSEAGATELTGVFGVAAPAIGQGTVVAGYSSGELIAYRYENGRVLWNDALSKTSVTTSVSTLTDIDANPVIDRGRVFAIGAGGRMVSVDISTGQRLWEINASGISTPWVAGEWVFVVTEDARVLCVSRGSGKVRWVSQLMRYHKNKKKDRPITWVGPVLAGDRLILANNEGVMATVSAADGQVVSQTRVSKAVRLAPVIANKTLLVLSDDGRLTAWR